MAARPDRAGGRSDRLLVAGVVVGAALAALGPLVGVLWTVLGLSRAFRDVESPGVDPSEKARFLANGISEAMNATILGIAGSMAGFVLAALCAIVLWRRRKRRAAEVPDGSS